MIMNYLKSLLWCFGILIISSIIITIFNYFNVINGIVLKIIFLIIPITSIFTSSYRLGKLSNEKGYIEGIKYVLIWVILFVVISLIRVMCIILPNVLLCVKKIDFKKKKMFSFMFLLILTVDMTVFTLFKYSFSVPKYSIKEIDFFETYFLPYLRWDTICSLFGNLTIIFATLCSIKRK